MKLEELQQNRNKMIRKNHRTRERITKLLNTLTRNLTKIDKPFLEKGKNLANKMNLMALENDKKMDDMMKKYIDEKK